MILRDDLWAAGPEIFGCNRPGPWRVGTPYEFVASETIDGDTIDAICVTLENGVVANIRIRVHGLDAPELRGPDRAAGLASKMFVERFLNSGGCFFVPSLAWPDLHGRCVAHVFSRLGSLTVWSIESGFGRAYKPVKRKLK